jgi:hypothetical protein
MSYNEKQTEFQKNTFGGANPILVADTTDTSGAFIALVAVNGDAELNSVTFTGGSQITTNITLKEGVPLLGNFITQFQLASGAVLAYQAQERA